MSIVIAALACVGVALVLSQLLDRLEATGRAAWGAAALALLFVVGLLDQTSPADSRGREADEAAWVAQRDFYRTVEDELRDGSAVFQLPVMEFPEVPQLLGTGPYDHALAFVHAPSLRWSFGGMKGRVPDPVPSFDFQQGDLMETSLRAQGFDAVVVDRAGYVDHGSGVEARLATVAGPPATVSADGRYSMFVID
jgi:phosphoglycerol transferase